MSLHSTDAGKIPRLAGALRLAVRALPVLVAAAMPVAAQTPATTPPEPPVSAAAEAGEDETFENPARGAARLAAAKPPYPPAVQKAIDEGRRECLAEGGTALVPGPGFLRTGDLTGDGRADFVVDFREARCTERPTVFSGTGGWDLEIFVARLGGSLVSVFAGRVLDYDLTGGPGPRTMTFRLHGSYCGRAGADPCSKRRRLSARPFAFRDR